MIGFTSKQQSILTVIMQGNPDGTYTDLDEVLERVNYETSKEAMQFSIRALIERGYLLRSADCELRRGRRRRIISPTPKAFKNFSSYLPTVVSK